MKAIVGVAGSATRIAMTQHHALRGNLGDVNAKDSAQETAVNLIASFAALFIITTFGNSKLIFLLMVVLHIVFNYLAVRAVCLRTLNDTRFLQVIEKYLKEEVIAAPCEINKVEPIIFYQLFTNVLDLKICGFQISLGSSLQPLVNQNPKAMYFENLTKVYSKRNYLLFPSIRDQKMLILIKDEATSDDILCSYFHAVLLSLIISVINDHPLGVYGKSSENRPFARICRTLKAAEWTRSEINEGTSPEDKHFNYEPTCEVMRYIDSIAQKEWHRIRSALLQTGWDLKRPLLMVDEWRVCNKILEPEPMEFDEIPLTESIITPSSKIAFGDILEDIDDSEYSNQSTVYMVEPESSERKIRRTSQISNLSEMGDAQERNFITTTKIVFTNKRFAEQENKPEEVVVVENKFEDFTNTNDTPDLIEVDEKKVTDKLTIPSSTQNLDSVMKDGKNVPEVVQSDANKPVDPVPDKSKASESKSTTYENSNKGGISIVYDSQDSKPDITEGVKGKLDLLKSDESLKKNVSTGTGKNDENATQHLSSILKSEKRKLKDNKSVVTSESITGEDDTPVTSGKDATYANNDPKLEARTKVGISIKEGVSDEKYKVEEPDYGEHSGPSEGEKNVGVIVERIVSNERGSVNPADNNKNVGVKIEESVSPKNDEIDSKIEHSSADDRDGVVLTDNDKNNAIKTKDMIRDDEEKEVTGKDKSLTNDGNNDYINPDEVDADSSRSQSRNPDENDTKKNADKTK